MSKAKLSHIEQFNGTNFQLWKYNFWLVLEQSKLLEIVEGRDLLPSVTTNAQGIVTNQETIDLWKEKDTNARLILMTTINSKEQQAFVNCRSANAIWTKLAAQHMQNASASTHVLQATFFHYQYVANQTLMQHITAIEGMAQQLEDLGQSMNQSQIMTKIVSTLPPNYRNFMTVWNNLGPKKTMPQLITKLMNEQHRNVNTNENSIPTKQAEAFVSQSRTKPRYNERFRERNDNKRPRLECTYCGKSNHDQSTCRRRLNAEAGIAEEKCSYCHNYGHLLQACRKKATDALTENKIKSSKAAFPYEKFS